MRYDSPKRAIDATLAGFALVLTAPVQLAVALAVALRLGRPVLFRQQRPGLGGVPFELIKFRTMRPVDVQRGWTDDASRLTPFGAWLRSTSLDELPTLWNVVRGDMSLVGPRPLLMDYLERYTTEQRCRHDVRPGITGLAQVSGRNSLSWEDKLTQDLDYIARRSLRLDATIMIRTGVQVVQRVGITREGHATAAEFTGTQAREHPE